jgi:hypothetical protein
MTRHLDDKILAVFKEAYAAGRMDVAEHLMRALESLQSEPHPGDALRQAYIRIGTKRERRRPRRH